MSIFFPELEINIQIIYDKVDGYDMNCNMYKLLSKLQIITNLTVQSY